jgi:hypothetical protein
MKQRRRIYYSAAQRSDPRPLCNGQFVWIFSTRILCRGNGNRSQKASQS